MKVLIADDNYLVREGIASAIGWEDLGFDDVFLAKNGMEALATVELTPPDLIITDIGMPYLNGLELIEKLNNTGQDIGFIIITGHDNSNYLRTAIRLNVLEYILKPINLDELKNAVYKAIDYIRKNSRLNEDYYYTRVFHKNKREYDREIRLDLNEDRASLKDCDIHEFEEAVSRGDMETASVEYEKICTRFLEKETCSRVVIQIVCNNVVMSCIRKIESLGGDMEAVFDAPVNAIREIFAQTCTEDMLKKLTEVFEVMTAYIETLSRKIRNPETERAKAYIESNYMKMDLSLNEVAKQVNMSPTYFSVMFKKEVGRSFIEYLTNIRIEKAKELFATTNMKVYEVAYLSGYDNPTYFSTLFKKVTGVSPQDYKKANSTA